MSVSAKQLTSRHIRRLRTIRRQLLEMSRQWEDLDQFCVTRLEELADQAENIAVELHDDDASRYSN